MEGTSTTSSDTEQVGPRHIAEAIYTALADYRGDQVDLVADDHGNHDLGPERGTVTVTAYTSDENGDDSELGTFLITVEQVI